MAKTYSRVRGGYLQTYAGIEVVLGLTDGGRMPQPGPAADAGRLSALDDVLTLAQRDTMLSTVDLDALRHLCLCAVGDAPDGDCVRRAYFTDHGGHRAYSETHRHGAALLKTSVEPR